MYCSKSPRISSLLQRIQAVIVEIRYPSDIRMEFTREYSIGHEIFVSEVGSVKVQLERVFYRRCNVYDPQVPGDTQ